MALERQGKLAQAEAAYKEAIRAQPGYFAPHFNLGMLLSRLGRRAEAEAALRATVRVQPDLPEAHWCLAGLLVQQGKAAEAEGAFREVVRLSPKDARAHYNLGVVLAQQGKDGEAEAAYRAALRLNPKYAEAHVNLGTVLLRRGQLAQAETNLREALRLKPRLPEAHLNLGRVLCRKGKLDQAVAACREAVRLRPKWAAAHAALGDAFARSGHWDKAAAALGRAVELNSPDPRVWTSAAALRLWTGDAKGYRAACRALLDRFGKAEAPAGAARVARACLLVPGAVANLEGISKLADRAAAGLRKDELGRHYLLKGLAEHRAGRHAAALDWLKRLPPKAGGSAEAAALAVRALAQHYLGRAKEARAALANARALLAKRLPDPAQGRPFGDDWDDWLHCRLLVREGDGLLR
jgi:Tfp pilus assembly protein PilF